MALRVKYKTAIPIHRVIYPITPYSGCLLYIGTLATSFSILFTIGLIPMYSRGKKVKGVDATMHLLTPNVPYDIL